MLPLRRFAALLLLAAAAAPGCALLPSIRGVPEATILGAEVVFAPLTPTGSGMYHLDLHIEGTGPHRALLDTGSSLLVLDTAVAESLDFGGVPMPMWIRGGGGSAWSWVPRGTLAELRIDGDGGTGARFLRTGAVVLDGPGEVAVVGLGLFHDCLVTLDFPARRIELRRGSLPEPDGVSVFPYEDRDGVPAVEIGIGDRVVEVTVDSGFNGALSLSPGVAEGLLFGEESLETEFLHVHGTGKAVVRRLLDPVRFGNLSAQEVPVVISDGPELLGIAFLRHLRITFDTSRLRLRIEPGGGDSLRPPTNPGQAPAPR